MIRTRDLNTYSAPLAGDIKDATTLELCKLYDALSSAVMALTKKGEVAYYNQAFSEWVGIQPELALDKTLGGLFPRLIAGDFIKAVEAVAVTGEGFSWTQQTHPDKLDEVEAAMTRGDRPFPLYRIACHRVALASTSLLIVEAWEMPPAISRPVRPAPRRQKVPVVQHADDLVATLTSDRYPLISLDRHGFIQKVNAAMCELSHYEESELVDKPIRILFPQIESVDIGSGYRVVIEALQQSHPDGALELSTATGEVLTLELEIFDVTGQDQEIALLCRDITRASIAQEAVHRQREQISALCNNVSDAVLLVDQWGYIEHANGAASELLALGHRRNDNLLAEELLRLRDARENWVFPVSEAMSRERPVTLMEGVELVVPGNPVVPVVVTATPIRDKENRVDGCVIVLRAVTESRRISTRLSWHETHDPLTQVANRRQIENEVFRAIDAAHIDNISHFLVYIDLYNFSVVNDTCGHAAGDELLRQFARLLSSSVGDQDVVARIGNDEFAVLLWHREPEAGEEEAEELLKLITEFSLPWGERRLKVGASMGVQLINRDSTSEIDVMLSASAACTAARELGRNRIQYQHLSQDSLRRHKLSKWTARISEALEEDRFVVYSQPIVPIGGQGDTRHYEALVRMLDPEGNLVLPGKFIPAAESSGLIDDIDRWVFDKVLSVLETLPPEKQQLYTFSINLSGPTVCDEKFREHVIERVRNSVLVPKAIHFEITETAAVKHFDRAVGFIRALKELGCAFSLDDFGSGLSSFGYLKQLPVDYLKIDGSFVRKMEAGDVEFSMVSTINHLAHVMGLKTIAECVENKAQLSLLEEMGVDFVQGYAISAPVPMETVL